jgi:hypothetical protein
MALPTRNQLLTQIDARYRELYPSAPAQLDPNNPSHAEMIREWWEAHHEILRKLTDEAFFGFYPDAPERLDPADPSHATYIEYWNDIAAQIDGIPGRHDWSSVAQVSMESGEEAADQIEMPVQDGSLQLEDRINQVHIMMESFAMAVGATSLGPKVLTHTATQIDALRELVRGGTFQTDDQWWRSPSFSESLYDESNSSEETAFVRDLALEAKIDRSTGVLDAHLSGFARDIRRDTSFNRVSLAGG